MSHEIHFLCYSDSSKLCIIGRFHEVATDVYNSNTHCLSIHDKDGCELFYVASRVDIRDSPFPPSKQMLHIPYPYSRILNIPLQMLLIPQQYVQKKVSSFQRLAGHSPSHGWTKCNFIL